MKKVRSVKKRELSVLFFFSFIFSVCNAQEAFFRYNARVRSLSEGGVNPYAAEFVPSSPPRVRFSSEGDVVVQPQKHFSQKPIGSEKEEKEIKELIANVQQEVQAEIAKSGASF